jgi:hypothetical protein
LSNWEPNTGLFGGKESTESTESRVCDSSGGTESCKYSSQALELFHTDGPFLAVLLSLSHQPIDPPCYCNSLIHTLYTFSAQAAPSVFARWLSSSLDFRVRHRLQTSATSLNLVDDGQNPQNQLTDMYIKHCFFQLALLSSTALAFYIPFHHPLPTDDRNGSAPPTRRSPFYIRSPHEDNAEPPTPTPQLIDRRVKESEQRIFDQTLTSFIVPTRLEASCQIAFRCSSRSCQTPE